MTVAVEDEEERRRIRGDGGLQSQRITCCVAMPTANGPGFLVATKAGVISLFAPSQEMEPLKRLSGAEVMISPFYLSPSMVHQCGFSSIWCTKQVIES